MTVWEQYEIIRVIFFPGNYSSIGKWINSFRRLQEIIIISYICLILFDLFFSSESKKHNVIPLSTGKFNQLIEDA